MSLMHLVVTVHDIGEQTLSKAFDLQPVQFYI